MDNTNIKELYKKYAVPDHIGDHMRRVADVSLFIAGKIIENPSNTKDEKQIDLKLLKNSALLHDIVKVCDFTENNPIFKDTKYPEADKEIWLELIKQYHSVGHIAAAATILKELGEEILAEIIDKHRFESITDPDPKKRPITIEEKILYYSDKRVMHDQIVPLDERLHDGHKRYNPNRGLTEAEIKIHKELHILEDDLCSKAGIQADHINQDLTKTTEKV